MKRSICTLARRFGNRRIAWQAAHPVHGRKQQVVEHELDGTEGERDHAIVINTTGIVWSIGGLCDNLPPGQRGTGGPIVSPPQLAAELNMSPKTLRGWLRRMFPREPFQLYSSWEMSPEMVSAARAHFGGRAGSPPARRRMLSPSVVTNAAGGSTTATTPGQGNGLHHSVLLLARQVGIELRLGTPLPGLTTRGHVMDHILHGVPAGVIEALRAIFEALLGDADVLAKKRVSAIDPDLVHPATGTLIEVDELQHFTSARLTTLRMYPSTASLGFNLDEYAALAERWRAKGDRAFAHKTAPEFPGEAGRQRQRAYLDSVRDLVSPHLTGRSVVRIATPNRDLVGAADNLLARLGPAA